MSALRAGSLVLTLVCWVSPARASDPALLDRVQTLLSQGVEPGNAQATIVALGDDGERALEGVFERESAPRYVRLRALNVLATLASPASVHYLDALVRAAQAPDERLGELHPARSPLVLRRALEGLANARLDLTSVVACLAHMDPQVRRAAANLLASYQPATQDPTSDARIAAALSALQTHESSRMVRVSVERALSARAALHR